MSPRALLIALCLCAAVAASLASAPHHHRHADSVTAQHEAQFAEFMSKYGMSYSSAAERAERFGYFVSALARAADLNRAHGTSVFGVTHLSDRSPAELKTLRSYKPSPKFIHEFQRGAVRVNEQLDQAMDVAQLPGSWDWRQAGVVTQVNDQQQCGACWAFSATETIESAYLLANPWMRNEVQNGWGLSVQEMLDCENYGLFGGCNGGWADLGYEFVKKSGLMNATDDPYQGETTACLPLAKPVTYLSNYSFATPPCLFNCNQQRMDLLQQSVATIAPVSVCLDAGAWDSYTGGIFPASACSSAFTSMDHCVQLVGYSINESDPTQSYWLVRNSWGTSWGVNGYIHLELNYSVNTCGLANQATNVITAAAPGLDEELLRFE